MSGGNGDRASVTAYGETYTLGNDANGILAQSIGGGGGSGGFSASGGLGGRAGVGVSLGGSGDSGGNAGAVSVNTAYKYSSGAPLLSTLNTLGAWTYQTAGERSNGILAQSIGGGGGNGGFSLGGGIGAQVGIGVSVGGMGSGAGNASTVNVTSVQNIHTSGKFSNAILAQSIGGGGGNGGFSAALGGGVSSAAQRLSVVRWKRW